MNRSTYGETVTCDLALTASALKGIGKALPDEQALFSLQKTFDVHIEKRPDNQHGNQSFSFFFDNETNPKLMAAIDGRVAVMDCVAKNDGFLAVGFHVRNRREPVATNRRLKATFRFRTGKSSGRPLPIELAVLLRELPVAEERSEYVKKRIGGWEGYLRIMEKNADVEDLHTPVRTLSLSGDLRKLSITAEGIPGKYWKGLPGFSAKFDGLPFDLGNVTRADRKTGRVDIELTPAAVRHARKTGFQGKESSAVTFSNFAELSQVRRLRKGFKDLQDGLAANANLEKILFEERPVVRITNRREPLTYTSMLNEFQEEAVSGAMNASDIYVIQGPPGTGKTTVISEICSQAAKAGMKTLVASQANLAVDNALGRLLNHQDIRILRYGRTESIEEEGRKFIEENVAEHWRRQTLETVGTSITGHEQLAAGLQKSLDSAKGRIEQLAREAAEAEDRKAAWQRQKEELSGVEEELKSCRRELQTQQLEMEKNGLLQKNLSEKEGVLKKELAEGRQKLESCPDIGNEIRRLAGEQDRLSARLEILRAASSAAVMEDERKRLEADRERLAKRISGIAELLAGIPEAETLHELKDLLEGAGYEPPELIDRQMISLVRQTDALRDTGGEEGEDAWAGTLARVEKAIRTVTDILHNHHFKNRITVPTGFRSRHSLDSIQETVNRVGRYLIQPSVKKILATSSFSVEAYDCLENLTKAVSLLHDRRNFLLAGLTEARTAADLYRSIREQTAADAASFSRELTNQLEAADGRLRALVNQLADIRQAVGSANGKAQPELFAETEAELQEVTGDLERHQQEDAVRQTLLAETEAILRKLEGLESETAAAASRAEQLRKATGSMEHEICRKERLAEQLKPLVADNPDDRLAQIRSARLETEQQVQAFTKKLENVPVIQSLQAQWKEMLETASPYDLDEIRKLYVKHANVIGTTCVASARKEFAEDYPQFDLVIIDEVSKATPPELLLPMLKGKKIILVGDHHQLPPLVGQETMEEFLEELPADAEKQEMESLLQESLFERLFRTLPKQNKTMLGKQYRMHEDIMKTITPFYNEQGYSLTCGLPDSDAVRNHSLRTPVIGADDHLLWIDLPNAPAFYEQKPKGGTSRFNESELDAVRTMLLEIEEGTAAAIRSGDLPADTKKGVGVISFYGEQVKRIDRLIQESGLQHLELRTGSVDKFQGMEMDIILVSFVRNHGGPAGDIGFAKDYRRLNVALSRAKELLVIIGSSDMFTKRPKSPAVRDMYRHLYDTVQNAGGIRSLTEPVNS